MQLMLKHKFYNLQISMIATTIKKELVHFLSIQQLHCRKNLAY